jgi:hypothetical protein
MWSQVPWLGEAACRAARAHTDGKFTRYLVRIAACA